MVKYFLSVITIAAFFMLRWLFPAEVKISPKAPDRVNPGDEFTYEVTISKTGVSGFAKIQQELPQGCTAEQIDVKGASFSCVGGVVKMIWMSLPSEDDFTISYKVKTEATISGSQNITGKFSFLENNEKKSVDMPVTSIRFEAPGAVASTTTATPTETPASTTSGSEVAATENTSTAATSSEVSSSNTSSTTESATAASTIGVTGERKISKTGEGKYKVDISIQNKGLSGFAKMQDVLPAGMLGYEDQSASAVFSFVGSKVKFVWMSVPDQRDIRISYVVTVNSEDDLKKITGEFSYLDNNETKRVSITTVSFPDGGSVAPAATTQPALAAKTETPASSSSNTDETASESAKKTETPKETVPEVTAQAPKEPKKAPKASGSTNNTTASSSANTNMAPSSNGVGYKVQVCASKKNIDNTQEYFSKNYSFTEEQIYAETHEGWMKYTIGSYPDYKAARDRRNEVTSKYTFPGPFVTAYNNGKRITVQEALMVTRDKWVP